MQRTGIAVAGAVTDVRHLVAVWNPSYARNAMEEHLAVLLRHASELEQGKSRDEDVYVWWGRVHSLNRRSDLPHVDDIRAIESTLASEDPPETNLYLTDYQSLYVADLAEIRFGRLPDAERSHVPAYYAADHLECDFWFKLWDIRRLVTDDILGTIEELKRLNNVHYHNRPVSLYGGMVELPLIVTRQDGASFFDEDERDNFTSASLWAEFDAQMGSGIVAVERALRDDLLGDSAWSALDPTVRTFIATGENVFREHRFDPAFDFSSVLGSFSKAIEVQLAIVLRHGFLRLTGSQRFLNIDATSVDLAERRGLTLYQLVQVLAGDKGRSDALTAMLVNGNWLTGQFAAVIDEFRNVRNQGTHLRRIDRKTAGFWRNQLLGVGSVGHFVELAKVKLR